MLWKTHIRIANEILFRLGLPKSSPEANQLREGSIAPDKWKDFPHHEGKSEDIKFRLLNSREFYLKNNLSKAYFNLGIALHYIQDGFTTLTSHSKHHTRWEHQIEQSYFTNDLQYLIDKAFRYDSERKQEYSKYSRILSNDVKGMDATLRLASMKGPGISYWSNRKWGKPYVDLNFALRASYIVAKSVLSSRNNPELQKRLFEAKKGYQIQLKRTEIQTAKDLVELIKKCDELKTGENDGFFKSLLNKIQNWRYKIKVDAILDRYERKEHLEKVAIEYQKMVNRITYPHSGWYNYVVPTLDINSVEKELLTKEEVIEELGINEASLQAILNERNMSSYIVESKELFRRSELEEVLSSAKFSV